MEFSYMKANVLTPKKEKYLSTFLIALGVAAAMFLPYMFMSEGYFTFYGDFNVQQIPFYQECHRAIRSGDVFWSWNTDLGANFIGSYSFYLLGSPFFWLTIPFPNSFVPYLMGPLLILKFALSALTGSMYIRRFTRTPQTAQLGGLVYAFSGFSVYNIFFNHFHEAIIFFPLLLLSMERLLTENKKFWFALAVSLCAVSNYFFFFGMVVFCVIYYFVRVLSKAVSFSVKGFLSLCFEAVLGVLLAAALLVPAIMAITDNYRVSEFLTGWNAIMYGKEHIYANVLQCFFFPPDLPARPVFFPNADVKWSSLGGWLPVFSTVGVFSWFHLKKKSWLGRVMGICIFMSMVPILNSAFYAFNTSYYARWFYMPVLMFSLATVMLLEDSKTNWSFGYKWVLGITVAVSLVIGFFPQKNSDDTYTFGLYTQDENNVYAYRFLASCAIAIVSLIIFGLLLKIRKTDFKRFYRVAVPCICIISVIYGNVFIATGRSHSYEIKDVMIDSLIEGEVDLGDSSQFRVDVYDGVDNTSMYLGLSGINAFHSIVPASVFEFYDFIGVERSVGSRPETNVTAIRPLLSVKYLLNRVDGDDFINSETLETQMEGYEYVKTESGYYIYENKNYIPYGFSYDYYMTYDFCESYGEENRPNMMLKAMLLTDEQIEKYGHILQNIEDIPEPDINAIEGKYISTDTTYEAQQFDSEQRALTSAYEFTTDNKGFTAKVTREKENLVFFSVPYDKGWSATVNGKPCEIEKVNAGFMAVKVDAGNSVIRFEYKTPYLQLGLAVTGLSAVILLIYAAIFSRKTSKSVSYPEGKLLIKEWHRQEIEEPEEKQEETEAEETDLLEIKPIPQDEPKGFDGGFVINTDLENE